MGTDCETMSIKNKKLAIIGASYLQLPLVMKAKELGVKTVCFAWEDGAVCRDYADQYYPISIVNKEKILSVCREEKIDGITTIATDVAVPTINYIAHELGLTGNSIESGFIATNKYAMREALKKGGVRCPFYQKITSVSDAFDAIKHTLFPVIIKPCDRSGSMGVTKIDKPEDLADAVKTALDCSFCKEAIMEKFIDIAQEISVEGISWKGKHHVLAITDKVTTGAPHYVDLGQHQPSQLSQSILDEAVRQVKLGVKALGIENGASHPELMVSKDGEVYVTEIGSRMGGDFIGSDLVYLSTGYDFLKGVIEIALGEFSGVSFGEKHYAGVWFYAPDTLQIKDIIQHRPQYPWIVRSELHEDELKPLTRSADRAGYFIYKSNKKISLENII